MLSGAGGDAAPGPWQREELISQKRLHGERNEERNAENVTHQQNRPWTGQCCGASMRSGAGPALPVGTPQNRGWAPMGIEGQVRGCGGLGVAVRLGMGAGSRGQALAGCWAPSCDAAGAVLDPCGAPELHQPQTHRHSPKRRALRPQAPSAMSPRAELDVPKHGWSRAASNRASPSPKPGIPQPCDPQAPRHQAPNPMSPSLVSPSTKPGAQSKSSALKPCIPGHNTGAPRPGDNSERCHPAVAISTGRTRGAGTPWLPPRDPFVPAPQAVGPVLTGTAGGGGSLLHFDWSEGREGKVCLALTTGNRSQEAGGQRSPPEPMAALSQCRAGRGAEARPLPRDGPEQRGGELWVGCVGPRLLQGLSWLCSAPIRQDKDKDKDKDRA